MADNLTADFKSFYGTGSVAWTIRDTELNKVWEKEESHCANMVYLSEGRVQVCLHCFLAVFYDSAGHRKATLVLILLWFSDHLLTASRPLWNSICLEEPSS